MQKLREFWRTLGWTRAVLLGFLILLWIVAATATRLQLSSLFVDCLVRTGMNGILVLALLPAIRAGVGLNFGLPLGIVCGLIGTVLLMTLGIRGWPSFFGALLASTVIAVVAGWFYALLLERVKGDEMMVGVYVGFAAVAAASIFWALAPVTNPELIWPVGRKGIRNTLSLAGYFKDFLDGFLGIPLGQRKIPTGLLLFWLGLCGLVGLFFRTRLGLAVSAAGTNPRFARASGIDVSRMRMLGVVLSTVLAAIGIVVFSQSFGFVQLYKAPLLMAFPTVAALLIGGASIRTASIGHVIIGTFLFQSVLTTALPLVNDLVTHNTQDSALGNIPEIARLIISNGIILYALTRKEQS